MADELRQSVKWQEQYVSAALNSKFAGIIPAGIYKGFELAPQGQMAVLVKHSDGYRKSVAVVERENYSITVIMDDPCTVTIPAKGTWYICVEAYYNPKQTGYTRLVAREKAEDYHVILGTVVADTDTSIIDEANISTVGRQNGVLSGEVLSALYERQTDCFTSTIKLSDRVTKLELAHIEHLNDANTNFAILYQAIADLQAGGGSGGSEGYITPAGYTVAGGATIAPVSIVDQNSIAPDSAALIMKVEEV